MVLVFPGNFSEIDLLDICIFLLICYYLFNSPHKLVIICALILAYLLSIRTFSVIRICDLYSHIANFRIKFTGDRVILNRFASIL